MNGAARRRTSIAGVVLLMAATPSRAQPSTNARISDLAANAAIGAAVAAARSVLAGRGLTRPLLVGAAGGALQGAGRQVAAGGSTAAGLLGRELSAAGISLTYSAGADSLILIAPAWLVTVEVRPREEHRVRARINLVDLALVATALLDGRPLDIGSTLSTGTPVFSLKGSLEAGSTPGSYEAGYSWMGVIYLADRVPPGFRPLALRHEAVHLLQWDAYNQLVAFPIERRALRGWTGGVLPSFLDVGALGPAAAYLLALQIPYERQPWEREAYRLTTGRPTP